MIDERDRCGRCGRLMPMLEVKFEAGDYDAWRECQNPRCLEAERAAETAYWAQLPDPAPDGAE